MTIPFYDNLDDDGRSGLVEIDRIYCFAFDRFSEADWAVLDRVYRALPEFVGYDPIPRWFSASEAAAPYLWASVEPSGLQVAGTLPSPDWHGWDEQFRRGAQGLPSREVE
jgi:hypothetical protein